jgi:hypothetical protein
MMMVRAIHRCEADIGSDSQAEGKFRFFVASQGGVPISEGREVARVY